MQKHDWKGATPFSSTTWLSECSLLSWIKSVWCAGAHRNTEQEMPRLAESLPGRVFTGFPTRVRLPPVDMQGGQTFPSGAHLTSKLERQTITGGKVLHLKCLMLLVSSISADFYPVFHKTVYETELPGKLKKTKTKQSQAQWLNFHRSSWAGQEEGSGLGKALQVILKLRLPW